MPSPIGHSLAGYAIYSGTVKCKANNWKIVLLYVLVANLPDFDFIPGFLMDTPNEFHRGLSHSIGLAIVIGIITSVFITKRVNLKQFLINVLIFSGLYFSPKLHHF